MESNSAQAYLKSVKTSPIKLLRVTRNVTGMMASDALVSLKFSKLKLAPIMAKLINSAMSNAENNHNLDIDKLYIKKFEIGKAYTLKRFRVRGRGKSSRILKPYSNARVILEEIQEEKKKLVKKDVTKSEPVKKENAKQENTQENKKQKEDVGGAKS